MFSFFVDIFSNSVTIKLTNQSGGIEMIKIAGKSLNKKGYIALGVLITLIAISVALTTHFTKASDVEPTQEIELTIEKGVLDDDLKEIDVVIRMGDTSWDIQKELTPNKDIAEILTQLEEINGKDLKNIKSGDIIKFAINK